MYLLDTSALIILLFGEVTNAKLSDASKDILENSDEIYLSEISIWEIAIKIKIQKIDIKESISGIVSKCADYGINMIPVNVDQFEETVNLPLIKDHGDPFDRLIISVAKMNDLTIISTDSKMMQYKDEYGVRVLD